ncbi:MAG: hypothetical protein GY751_22405 [Bacteroidetes bacterium]|nr:hypothetical protein [Bacteroidota bacterium]
MKKVLLSALVLGILMFPGSDLFAGGGQAGISPGSGFKLRFGNMNTDLHIPIQFRAEVHLGDEGQHGIGGSFSYDIGTKFTPNFAAVTPHYHYYFKPEGCGPYVGGYADFRFRGNLNDIGIGAKGGYRFKINEDWGIWAEANVGFNTLGGTYFNKRWNGGEVGFNAGAFYKF